MLAVAMLTVAMLSLFLFAIVSIWISWPAGASARDLAPMTRGAVLWFRCW